MELGVCVTPFFWKFQIFGLFFGSFVRVLLGIFLTFLGGAIFIVVQLRQSGNIFVALLRFCGKFYRDAEYLIFNFNFCILNYEDFWTRPTVFSLKL